MVTPHPRLSLEGHVARIVLDRPERHNALGAADLAAFRAHLATVEADPSIRVLVLTGSGADTFCSGASLDQIASGEMSGRIFETLTEDLAASRVPTICALNGSVYGGGTEIALCCDFRIGVHGTRMAVPAARLGICYPASGLGRFVDAIGPVHQAAAVRTSDQIAFGIERQHPDVGFVTGEENGVLTLGRDPKNLSAIAGGHVQVASVVQNQVPNIFGVRIEINRRRPV